MNKKITILIAVISTIISTVFCFMPCIYLQIYWQADTPGIGIYSRKFENRYNIFEAYTPQIVDVLAVLFLILNIISIVVLIMIFLQKSLRWEKFLICSPVVSAVVFLLMSVIYLLGITPNGEPYLTASYGYYGYFDHKAAWGFYIEFAFLVLSAIISIVYLYTSRKKSIDLNSQQSTNKSNPNIKNEETEQIAKDLREYKALLDCGIITQDEYDIKKKQLLNL